MVVSPAWRCDEISRQALRRIRQKKKPSESVEAGVNVIVLLSDERGRGVSVPKSARQALSASTISKSGLEAQKWLT